MHKPPKKEMEQLRSDFELWVDNPHMLNYFDPPDHDEYEHPWTRGAWAAWREMYNRKGTLNASETNEGTHRTLRRNQRQRRTIH